MPRALVLDVSALIGSAPAQEVAMARALADPPIGPLIRDDGRSVATGVGQPSEHPVSDDRDTVTAFAAVRAWLLGDGAPPRQWRRRAAAARSWSAATRAAVPQGSLVVRVGLSGWDEPRARQWLAARPDLRPVALLGSLRPLAFPEYEPVQQVARLDARLAGLAGAATAAIVPSDAARRCLAAALAPRRRGDLPIEVVPVPSCLAGTRPDPPDAALAAMPYVVLAGPIEAGGNVELMLNLWRDLIASGRPVPKLVLAGQRGAQVDLIAPLLDWGETIRPFVCEAPDLGPQHLRGLLAHARALLAPAFWSDSGALVRDAAALGTPVLASDIPTHSETASGPVTLLDPIDGRGWSAAVGALAQSPLRPPPPASTLPDWPGFRGAVLECLERMP